MTCRMKNTDIPRAGRDEAAHCGTLGRDGQDGTPTGRFAQDTAVPLTVQTIEENKTLLGASLEERTSDIYVNRRKNKTRG